MKEIFTRKQAIAIIQQINNGMTDVSFKFHVDPSNPLFKLSNEQLYEKLCSIIDEDTIAGVVEEITEEN